MGRTKRIYLFNESHLPDGGWLQMCLRCDTITGGLLLFRVDQVEEHLLEYRVHLCSGCRRTVERNTGTYFDLVEDCTKVIDAL